MIKNKVHRARIQALVDALRSGKYNQAKGVLREASNNKASNRFCCLGVACHISKVGKWKTNDDEVEYAVTPESIEAVLLPPAVSEFFGFEPKGGGNVYIADIYDPVVLKENFDPSIEGATSLNDDKGRSFKQIADCFEYTFLMTKTQQKAKLKELRKKCI